MNQEIKIKTNSEKFSDIENDVVKLSGYRDQLESMMKNHDATIVELKSKLKNYTRKSKINNDMDELSLILEKSSKNATQYESNKKQLRDSCMKRLYCCRIKRC